MISTFLSFLRPVINAYALNSIAVHILYIVFQEYKKWVVVTDLPGKVAPIPLQAVPSLHIPRLRHRVLIDSRLKGGMSHPQDHLLTRGRVRIGT